MKPTREEAEKAVETLLAWAGDNPQREGLLETPRRVVGAFEEHFRGYNQNPYEVLNKKFTNPGEHEDGGIVVLRDIQFESFCEHHIAPFTGYVHIAYVPGEYIVGISKLARLVNIFAKRLQIQERFTSEIATSIEKALSPVGCIVLVEANHHCLTTRGALKPGSKLVTSCTTGIFKKDEKCRRDALLMLAPKNS